tara:strand:- start:917 stop:1561 length:645 start_codon:yes stop_codon:yes gene_type:complete
LSIGKVLNEVPEDLVRHVYVCNNASTDDTGKIAHAHNAIVLNEPNPGYGNACLRGLNEIAQQKPLPDIVVFIDGDYSDYPEDMRELVRPIIDKDIDMVIGSRATGDMEKGSMTPQQVFGNWLATTLIKMIYDYKFTDLGPFRALKYSSLIAMNMEDKTYGWTVEMQVKAAKMSLKCSEIPVRYRKRIGVSKISGTVKGTILAGHKILWTIFKLI